MTTAEWLGEVVDVGANVSGLQPGERGVGECVIKTPERIHQFGFSMNRADPEFFTARPEWLHKLPDAVDDAKGALIEPFTSGSFAVMRHGGVNVADTVVISGGGTIELVAAAAAIGMGARVIVVDPVMLRREIALRLGVDPAVDPSEGDPVEAVQGLTKGAPIWWWYMRVMPRRLQTCLSTRGPRAMCRWSGSISARSSRSSSARFRSRTCR